MKVFNERAKQNLFTLKNYIPVQSPEQAYQLLTENKNNIILGGMLWMKMGKKQYHTGIDLKDLGLDRIQEAQDTIKIGAMTTLRQMETSPVLSKYFGPVFSAGLGCIVGIQFRNLATLGGSVYSRFGFSDVITALLSLDTHVHLYKRGIISLENFLKPSKKRDILLGIIIKKSPCRTSFQSLRLSAADFPVLSIAVSLCQNFWKISVGARPGRACLAKESAELLPRTPDDNQISRACNTLAKEIVFGTDKRGSGKYRQSLAEVLLKRGIKDICS